MRRLERDVAEMIPLLRASRGLLPFIERVFADSAYAAERVTNATRIIVEIVRKQVGQIGFAVHPRRWVRRTLLRLARPQSPFGQGLRGNCRLGNSLPLKWTLLYRTWFPAVSKMQSGRQGGA